VILALILLHFCGGAQALHLPIRGLPQRGRPPDSLPGAGRGLAVAWGCAFCPSTGAGCGLAAALGCESLGQTAAPPLRAVEHKHNCTSLFTRGERLQQSAGLGRGRPSDSSTGAGRDLAAALGCVPQRQAAATPLRVVESKHNCTSLLTVGEMLQQRAWIPQRALLQAGTGQDSSALLRN